jgi:hypothetical protein
LGNRAQVLSNLTVDPQLRAAIDQIPDAKNCGRPHNDHL